MKKVAIVGSGEGWKDAPFADPSWEIWSLNYIHISIKRVESDNNEYQTDAFGHLSAPISLQGTHTVNDLFLIFSISIV